MSSRYKNRPFAVLTGIQGAYFLVTGLWPLVHIRSFLAVTGEKEDVWLVETVGVLVFAVGAGLVVAATHRQVSLEIMTVAVFSAIGLAAIDTIYVVRGRILPIYLADVGVEAVLVALWLFCYARNIRYRDAAAESSSIS
jgi:hypothetical protein